MIKYFGSTVQLLGILRARSNKYPIHYYGSLSIRPSFLLVVSGWGRRSSTKGTFSPNLMLLGKEGLMIGGTM